ncbi:hypothetical protein OEZ85_010722 [Tetradesmus obliquus]|uniref:U2A'/phosphoprotein 32 family A C-terminal domain-containing protein n=1 Tax=Tetradesmus obliquus TaxID=3088 RepID=A0ABY8TNS8_TETOB|nr:hypothetical protein OEZ85_010722 [Tetradesmus obliquus]
MEQEEHEGFAALLDANGLTEADVDSPSSSVTELEMFLQQYSKMVGLKRFPFLTTLKLIDQCIERIEGLSGCPKLQKLWLMENRISKIEGLAACTGLQELYLYSNRITSITGLDHLTGLKDVANLAKLTGLQELCLADPFWGECPVAGLCNYQTFMLYLMPHLSSLDTLLLAAETKAAACATFTKKQLYYNMRIRTMRRAAAGLLRQAKAGCQVVGSRWVSLLSELAFAERALDRQLHHAADSQREALQAQLSSIQAAATAVQARQEQLTARLAADAQASAAALEDAVARLQLELSSGGNIRLEEARADEPWLASCQELLRSRLLQAGEPGGVHGITDVQVVSAARIHNRHLRLHFDKLQSSGSGCGSGSSGHEESKRQCTDYLFYGEHPAMPGELMHVVQHGFRPCSNYRQQGLDGAVRLANCVNLADQLRMHVAIEQASSTSGSGGSSGSSKCVLEGQLLVCKLSSLTQLSLHDCGLTSCGSLLGHLPALLSLVLSFNILTGLDDLLPHGCSACQLTLLDVCHNQISSWQGRWLAGCSRLAVLDASHNSLSEISSLQQLTRSAPQLQQLDLRGNAVQQNKAYQMHVLSDLLQLQQLDGQAVTNPGQPEAVLSADTIRAGATLWHSDTGPVGVPPAAPAMSAAGWQQLLHTLVLEGRGLTSLAGLAAASRLVVASFAANLLTGLQGLQGCGQLQELNVSGNLVTELGELSRMSSLRQLDASGNCISSLLPLAPLTGLSQLSVEGNQLSSLAGLASMTGLLELYAAHNAVADVKEAERLSVLPRLVILYLEGNPLVAAAEDYRHLLLYRLRHLKVLDGAPATAAELATARAKYSGRLTTSFLEEQLGSSCSLTAIRSLDVSGLRIRDVGSVFIRGTPFASLAELVLDDNPISSLAPLAGLTALQWLPGLRSLFVSGNELQRLDGLEGLGQLRELVADRNKIRVLEADALAPLVRLRELRLEDNAIRSLCITPAAAAAVPSSPSLVAVAGDGSSSSLGGLLPSLCVLQLAGNRLMDMAELDRLALLPGLLEVALAGNPLARKQVYRPMLISRCPQLQVIDSQQVTPQERDYAEEMFALPPADAAPADAAAGLLAAVSDSRGGWAPLTVAAAMSGPGSSSCNGRAAAAGKMSAVSLPAVINYEALAQAMAAGSAGLAVTAAGLSAGGGLQLPGVVSSVPSIQSGVLVLSGSSAFGLEGTSIGLGSSSGRMAGANGSWAGGKQRPVSGGRRTGAAGSAAGGCSPTRRVTGPARVEGSGSPGRGFPARQIVYKGY